MLRAFICFFIPIIFTSEVNAQIGSLEGEVIIKTVNIAGNKVTKDHVILRELTFTSGDTVPGKQLDKILDRSRQNLFNTSLFNFVTITWESQSRGMITINIELVERWYIWPLPLFELAETNFNTWWQKKDLTRVNYGFYVIKENFRGRRESLRLMVRMGYDEQYALQYLVPYLTRDQTLGIGITAGLSRNHEITYKTENHVRQFYKNTNKHVREEMFARITMTYRQHLYNAHNISLQYNYAAVDDTLKVLTGDYFKNNTTQARYLKANWYFRRDKRDNIAYPLNGFLFSAEMSKYGLGLASTENLNVLFGQLRFNSHHQLSERLYFANGLKTRFSLLDNPPYYLQRGLGYRDFVRGYEFYVIDGQHYGLVKNNLKLALVKQRTGHLDFIRFEQFSKFYYALYLNAFFDAGYVIDDLYHAQNPVANRWHYGAGLGLDLVAYYDLVMRMEYSFNKFGEHGFFLHFTKSI